MHTCTRMHTRSRARTHAYPAAHHPPCGLPVSAVSVELRPPAWCSVYLRCIEGAGLGVGLGNWCSAYLHRMGEEECVRACPPLGQAPHRCLMQHPHELPFQCARTRMQAAPPAPAAPTCPLPLCARMNPITVRERVLCKPPHPPLQHPPAHPCARACTRHLTRSWRAQSCGGRARAGGPAA